MANRTSAVEPPFLSFVVADGDDDLFDLGFLPSLAANRQRGSAVVDYEVVVVTRADREAALRRAVEALPLQSQVVCASDGDSWPAVGAARARGGFVCFVGDPGVASPTLLAALFGAVGAYPELALVIPTLPMDTGETSNVKKWLEGLEKAGDTTTPIQLANPENSWLDAIADPKNLLVPRKAATESIFRRASDVPRPGGEEPLSDARVQLVGDGFVRPRGTLPDGANLPNREDRSLETPLHYFGLITRPQTAIVDRPIHYVRNDRPRLSVVLIIHEMRREAPRTIRSLLPPYQRDVRPDDYEIIVVENGSRREPLDELGVRSLGPNLSYSYLEGAPPSPARAINFGAARATGDVLAIMVDGACLLSPGVLAEGLRAFRTFPFPVVATRYFSLGSGSQRQTMLDGYDRTAEDELLRSIEWPADGYRLFEIGSPLTFLGPTEHWFTAWFESNCLFLSRDVFEKIGGCDERFDFPGGGNMNIDLFRRACDLPETQPVELLGEGVFHQIHGGITTNTPEEDALRKRGLYDAQYVALRGIPPGTPLKSFYFLGALPTPACRRKMRG